MRQFFPICKSWSPPKRGPLSLQLCIAFPCLPCLITILNTLPSRFLSENRNASSLEIHPVWDENSNTSHHGVDWINIRSQCWPRPGRAEHQPTADHKFPFCVVWWNFRKDVFKLPQGREEGELACLLRFSASKLEVVEDNNECQRAWYTGVSPPYMGISVSVFLSANARVVVHFWY